MRCFRRHCWYLGYRADYSPFYVLSKREFTRVAERIITTKIMLLTATTTLKGEEQGTIQSQLTALHAHAGVDWGVNLRVAQRMHHDNADSYCTIGAEYQL